MHPFHDIDREIAAILAKENLKMPVNVPDIRNISLADFVALRAAFSVLVDRNVDIADPTTLDKMLESDRNRVLLSICNRLASDGAPMLMETCRALDMLPGNTFADGAARAKDLIEEMEASRG